MATDMERREMLARDLTGALIGVLYHINKCTACWERWLGTLRCMEEEFNGINRGHEQGDQESSENVESKVPPIL